jgi:hypothetical protein
MLFLVLIPITMANTFVADLSVTSSSTVYAIDDRIEVQGFLYLSNYTDAGVIVSNRTALSNATVNISVINKNTNETDAIYQINVTNGEFYSRNDYYSSAPLISAPSTAADYFIEVNYSDPNETKWFTQTEIEVNNESIDRIAVSSDAFEYSTNESMIITVEAIKEIGDRLTYVANVSINGSVRNSSKGIVSSFNCTTGNNGKCALDATAPSSYGDYYLEVNNFKAFTTFRVEEFQANILMKDELGQSIKHTFVTSEDASIEVAVLTNSTSETYIFEGDIRDSDNSKVLSIETIKLNTTNFYTNRFKFTIDPLNFSAGTYFVNVNVTKTGGEVVDIGTSFNIKAWDFLLKKRDINSGFNHEYSSFSNKTLYLEIYPSWRANATIIDDINYTTAMNISLVDDLNNVIEFANSTWNDSCGSAGCYEFNVTAPTTVGEYYIDAEISYEGESQHARQKLKVIDTTLSAQSTDKEGTLKDLFGTNEYVYLSLSSKNITGAVNLSNASVVSVIYSNGSEYSFTKVATFNLVNATNNDLEWGWNDTSQRLKLDAPRAGGVYTVYLSGDNNTVAGSARFIINPYDICLSAKNTPGQAGGSTSYYYVYHFKTSDSVYFELKITQANNPTGRASAFNLTVDNSTYGGGVACADESATKQVVNNATITVSEVINTQNGKSFPLNSSETSCQSDDEKGTYTCTITPIGSWDGGSYSAKFDVLGQDAETYETIYGGFEARAFYIYARSSTWYNKPDGDVSLTIDMYEAGDNWWGNVGSGGLSGTATIEKIEYQGSIGEWLATPIDYAYNVSNVSSSTITNGRGTMTLTAANAPGGEWKTGYYRAILQGTDNGGTSDYGYAYFSVKRWQVYATPVECSGTSCNSIWNTNSKNNISLYITINNAGEWGQSGNTIGGETNITVKKINDCRNWPCTELNSSTYTSTVVSVDRSSGWYSSGINESYLLNITPVDGTWGTGYWQVVLDVNGTESGTGWFNTIAFYTKVRPTDSSGATWKYSIKNNDSMYVNVTTVKSQKSGYYYDNYNQSDYINTTFQDAFLKTWDKDTYNSIEYSYPEDFNITIIEGGTQINGSSVLNITFNNGSWKSGYYSGDLELKNIDNETANGRVWFQVLPFRVQISKNQYEIDNDDCINGTINIYDPDQSSNTLYNGTYNITLATERVWTGSSNTLTTYTNVTPASTFNNTANFTVCPNGAKWGAGSWNNHHYLTIRVADADGNTEDGWVSFKAVPFSITWGDIQGGTEVLTTNNVVVPINLTKAISGADAVGNLSKIYQWRYDNYYSRQENYVFSIGECFSNVSGNCQINGSNNLTVYAPSGGWVSGYNYIQAEWLEADDSSSKTNDYSGVWFNGKAIYNGWYELSNSDGISTYQMSNSENLTIRLYVQDNTNNATTVNVTKVEYATDSKTCSNEGCRVYTEASFALVGDSDKQFTNSTILTLAVPSSNWTAGKTYIRATVTGDNGTTLIKNENVAVNVRDLTVPVISITTPTINSTVNTTSYFINWTTNKDSSCWLEIWNYDTFHRWYCSGWENNDPNNGTSVDACNITKYGLNGTTYDNEFISKTYHYWDHENSYGWNYLGGISPLLTTGGTSHSFNASTTGVADEQDYGIIITCFDAYYNTEIQYGAFKLNTSSGSSSSTNSTAANVTLSAPSNNGNGTVNPVDFNFTIQGPSTSNCSLYGNWTGNWSANITTNNLGNGSQSFNQSLPNGTNIWNIYCVESANASNFDWGDSNFTFTYNDTTVVSASSNSSPVNVTLSAPANNANVSVTPVIFNYSFQGPSTCNCSLYGNWTGNWTLNLTNTDVSNGSNSFNQTIANGTYIWNVLCTNSTNTSDFDWGDSNFTFVNQGEE